MKKFLVALLFFGWKREEYKPELPEKPSIEDMAEVMDKFEEDVLRKTTASIRGERRAVLVFGEPIEVDPKTDGKGKIHALTEHLEKEVQALLDSVKMD